MSVCRFAPVWLVTMNWRCSGMGNGGDVGGSGQAEFGLQDT
jgi:hypothetical protein